MDQAIPVVAVVPFWETDQASVPFGRGRDHFDRVDSGVIPILKERA